MSVKFELKKIFYNRFFPAVLIIAVLLNLFILYENGAPEEKAMQYNTYDEFVDSVQAKAEKTLSVSVFSDELSEFSKKNIIKTAEDFEKMRGIEISPDINTGIKIILNPGISDIFILLLLIVAGLALITDEKEKRLFHLIRSTARGTAGTIISKLSALLICCVIINFLFSGSAAVYAYINYGFGDVFRSIQSVPDMLTAYLRLNILQFLSVLFILKTAGVFILGVIVLFLCLITSRAITMLVSVVLLSGSSFFMTFIPETSVSGFFRYINLCSLLNPYRIFGSYVNLNIFGLPVSVNAVFTVFFIAMLILSLSAVIFYFIKKRPLENREKRNTGVFSQNKIRCGIAYFECKKLLSINKAAAIILAFALLQTYNVYKQESFMSSDEYAYKYYTEMLIGPLTGEKEELIISEKEKLSYAEQQLKIINEQRRDNQLSMQEFIEKQKQYSGIIEKSDVFSRVYEKYLHVKNHPGAEFIYDTGYERLFSISDENFSLFNSLLLLTVFALCLCSIYSVEYKTQAYRLLCTTKYGRDRTRRIKYGLSIALSLVIFIIAYAPELIFTGRFYGFPELKGQLLSIPGLSGCGGLPIWAGILIHYVFRLLAVFLLVPVIAAISLKTKNNIITAIIFSVIFVLPGAVYYFSDIKPVLYLSFFNLFSGSMLAEGFVYLIQFAVLTAASYISARYIYRRAIS